MKIKVETKAQSGSRIAKQLTVSVHIFFWNFVSVTEPGTAAAMKTGFGVKCTDVGMTVFFFQADYSSYINSGRAFAAAGATPFAAVFVGQRFLPGEREIGSKAGLFCKGLFR